MLDSLVPLFFAQQYWRGHSLNQDISLRALGFPNLLVSIWVCLKTWWYQNIGTVILVGKYMRHLFWKHRLGGYLRQNQSLDAAAPGRWCLRAAFRGGRWDCCKAKMYMWKKETVQLQVQATSDHFRLGCYKPADIYIYISCDWVDHMSNFASTLCLSPFVGPEARLLQLVAVHKDVVKDVSRTGANVPAKHLRSRSSDRGRELNARHDSYIECFDVGRTGFLIVVANQLYMFSHVFPTLVL